MPSSVDNTSEVETTATGSEEIQDESSAASEVVEEEVVEEEFVADENLVALIEEQNVFIEDQIEYLSYINSTLIINSMIVSLVLGALLARFFFERLGR